MRPRLLALLLLGAGCGDQPADMPPPISAAPVPAEAAEPETPEPAETGPTPEQLRATIAAIRRQVEETRERALALDERMNALLAIHREELRAFGELSDERVRYRRHFTRAKKVRNQIAYRRGKLGPEDAGVEELVARSDALDVEQDRLENELDDRRRAAARLVFQAELKESPVARDLRRIRAVQDGWLALTQQMRRKRTYSSRNRINGAFREWLEEDAELRRVTDAALALHPRSASPRSADRFDFTKLEFFVLCQMLEDDLDRRNIAVEQDKMAEMRTAIDAVSLELDALADRRGALERLPGWKRVEPTLVHRAKIELLHVELAIEERKLAEVTALLAPLMETEVRHERERLEIEEPLATAREAYRAAQRTLAELIR